MGRPCTCEPTCPICSEGPCDCRCTEQDRHEANFSYALNRELLRFGLELEESNTSQLVLTKTANTHCNIGKSAKRCLEEIVNTRG